MPKPPAAPPDPSAAIAQAREAQSAARAAYYRALAQKTA